MADVGPVDHLLLNCKVASILFLSGLVEKLNNMFELGTCQSDFLWEKLHGGSLFGKSYCYIKREV